MKRTARGQPRPLIFVIFPEDTSERNELYLDMQRGCPDCDVHILRSTREIELTGAPLKAILFDSASTKIGSVVWNRKAYPTAFLAVHQPGLVNNPEMRYAFFQAGVNMVSHDTQSIVETLRKAVLFAGTCGGSLSCPYCPQDGLTEDELWHHMPAFHINCPNEKTARRCPVCTEMCTRKPLQVHVHDDHGPEARRRLAQQPGPGPGPAAITVSHSLLNSYSLVVCRHPETGDLLLCQEFGDQGFWTPGGAVDPGEDLVTAAVRETLEEAGMDVVIKGILSIQYVTSTRRNGAEAVTLHAIFYAEPADLTQLPKSIPDFESVGASWCSHESIMRSLKLRGREPRVWSQYLQAGGAIHPLSLLVQGKR